MGKLILTWKDKILDYEIETVDNFNEYMRNKYLEKIRFSITRLKQNWCWCCDGFGSVDALEKIRFSITRLKPPEESAESKGKTFTLKR